MAWIDKRPKKGGGFAYLVRWREPSGKVASSRRRTYDEARTLKAEVESSLLKGSYVAQEARRRTFSDYAGLVLDSDSSLAQATRANYDTCLRLHLAPLARIPIEEVDPARVRALFAALSAKGASGHTLHKTREVLSKVCSAAVEDGILTRNPAKAVKVPKQERREVEPLTPEQVEQVSKTVPERWECAVLVGAWGGLRIGEVGALTKDDIDWERGSIRVSKSVGRYGVKEAKTKASNRVVTLPDFVMKKLAAHILKYVEEVDETVDATPPTGAGSVRFRPSASTSSALLFPTEYGNAINAMTIAPIMRKTGVRFHDLRHTQAALLIKSGANALEIKERMGHASIKITYDVYGHLFEGAHDELARKLEQYEPEEMGKVVELHD